MEHRLVVRWCENEHPGESLFVILAVGIAAGWLAGQMNGGPGSHPRAGAASSRVSLQLLPG